MKYAIVLTSEGCDAGLQLWNTAAVTVVYILVILHIVLAFVLLCNSFLFLPVFCLACEAVCTILYSDLFLYFM